MKKRLLSILLGTALLAALVGCGSTKESVAENDSQKTVEKETATEAAEKAGNEAEATDSGEKTIVNVTLASASVGAYIDQYLGISEEIFADDNVEIVYSTFANGPAMLEALEGGSVDIVSTIGELPVITSIAAGRDITVIRIMEETCASYVVVPVDSEITEVAELKGKTVGVTNGTVTHYVLLSQLLNAGISTDDVEIVNLSRAEADAALAGGDIDATVTSTNDSMATEVKSISDNYYNMEFTLARGEFAKEHPEIVAKYLLVLEKAQEYITENPEEAAAYIAEQTGRDEAVLTELFRSGVYEDSLKAVSEEQIEKWKELITFAYEQELITTTYNPTASIDDSYVEKALALQ